MKLSTKGRYGARLMLDLAVHHGKGQVLLKDIAKRQEISEKYLGHLMPPLKAVGLINSSRGAHGGYSLNKSPKKITLGQIVRAVEGDMSIVECVSSPDVCDRVDFCVTRDIWNEISKKVADVLDSVTLQDMVAKHNKKLKSKTLTYNI